MARGATVIGTSSESNHDYLRSLGAVPVTYGDGLVDRVRAAELGITFSADSRQPWSELADHARLAADGRLRVRIAQSFPLADAGKAHELSEAGHPHGKLILRP